MSSDGHAQRLEAALAGRYKVQKKLGEGGMASVYLAEDIKHERKVALKILKPELAAVIGAERFLAEIKTTANLQHPHILPLFDSGEADGFLYYVMPYIEGETLRDRIEREQQLGVDEAVRIARDVADALDYAHRNDIIHRDIKPANILLHDGRPVVADFGIALAISAAGGGRMTETGLSLGTPHYMSPEQASADRDLSARSDVYSLGCVLYEMLAGQPPHTGPSAQSILVRILTEDPRELTELRRTVPAHVAAVVMKAIEKLPADRFDTARQFMEALDDPSFTYSAVSRTRTGRTPVAGRVAAAGTPSWLRPSVVVPWAAAVLFAALAAWNARGPATPEDLPTTRAALDVEGMEPIAFPNSLRVSPDGRTFLTAFVSGGWPRLALRRSDEASFQVLPGVDSVLSAAFSPDGEWIAYGGPRGLMKVSARGGAPQLVLPAADGNVTIVMDWGPDGSILFWRPGGVGRVSESGGDPTPVFDGSAPAGQFLPGGNVLLGVGGVGGLTSGTPPAARYVDVARDTSWIVVPGALGPRYLPAVGSLVWADETGALWAAPFDLAVGTVTGPRSIVMEGITLRGNVSPVFDVSSQGTLVYATGVASTAPAPTQALATVALDGAVEVEDLDPRVMNWPRWSPDGRFVAYSGEEAGEAREPTQIFTYDMVVKSRPRRVTTVGLNQRPAWSPDGTRLVFSSLRDGTDGADLFVKTLAGDEPEKLLLSRRGAQFASQWVDERHILITNSERTNRELWVVELPEEGSSDTVTARPYFESENAHEPPFVAPQGDLAVYSSYATGQWEVYVRSFPVPGTPEKISEGGGDHPHWSADGNSIYYKNAAGDSLMVARIDRGPPFAVLGSRAVMAWPYGSRFDLHPDGDRFIAMQTVEQSDSTGGQEVAPPTHYFVVTNWFDELRRRSGEGGR